MVKKNKGKDKILLATEVNPKLAEFVKQQAKENDRSVSAQLRVMINYIKDNYNSGLK